MTRQAAIPPAPIPPAHIPPAPIPPAHIPQAHIPQAMHRDPERGVILINVLVILALSSTVVFAMLRLSDTAITRSQRYGDAGQAAALIDGGEATAIAALRRDLRDAPRVDHPREPWAQIAQDRIAVEGGTFSLAIADAQARFNLTNLSRGTPEQAQILQRILAELDLPESVGLRILARLAGRTPLFSLEDLLDGGIAVADVQRLSALVTVLPQPTTININTMPDAMFAVLAGNPVQARLLQGLRARKGLLTLEDVLGAGLVLTTGAGVQSAYFTVTTRVTVGAVTLARDSLLRRVTGADGASAVITAARRTVP